MGRGTLAVLMGVLLASCLVPEEINEAGRTVKEGVCQHQGGDWDGHQVLGAKLKPSRFKTLPLEVLRGGPLGICADSGKCRHLRPVVSYL